MNLGFDERDRESVLRDLVSEDEEVRRLAVERIEVLSPEEAIGRMVERLGDESWRVRKAAVERLVACPDLARATDALVQALGDGENSGRRNAAVEALIETGSRALPRLIEASHSEDADVRKLVVDSLAGIGDPRAVGDLVRLLADGDANVRAASADALGAIGGDDAVAPLRRAATDDSEDALVRFSALHALATLEIPVRAREIGSVLADSTLRPAGLALLGRDDDEEDLAVLLKSLASGSRATREAAMRSLLRLVSAVDGARADAVAERIREAARASRALLSDGLERLADADLSTRLVLVQFLGLLRAEEAVVPMLRAARDEALEQVVLATLESLGETAEAAIDTAWSRLDGDARRTACTLFGRTGGERGAARLLAALDDADSERRVAAARAIGHRRLSAGLAPLVLRLETAAAEDEFEDREELAALCEALIALARPDPSGDDELTERAIELLASRLQGASEPVRLAIARVVGCIGRPRDTQIVELLLKDPGAPVRRAAVDALARLEPGTAAEPLRLALADESAPVRIAAARALAASADENVLDDLRRLAGDEDRRVRAAAAHAVILRFLPSREPAPRAAALEVVDAAFADEAPVALAAVEALRSVGGEDTSRASALLGRSEPEVVQEAVRCLGAGGDAEAALAVISHPNWSVRAEAIQMLAERGVVKAIPPILRRLETEQDEFVRGTILRALERLGG